LAVGRVKGVEPDNVLGRISDKFEHFEVYSHFRIECWLKDEIDDLEIGDKVK